MPYEYLSMGRVSEKTDSFAAGIVLIELLVGSNGRIARGILENSATVAIEPAVTKFILSGGAEGGLEPVRATPPEPTWPAPALGQLCGMVDNLTHAR